MKHIVKLTLDDMKDEDAWRVLIFQLDPAADPGSLVAVELIVDTVFFPLHA